MTFSVIGCGRWGSFIAWYLHSLGYRGTLYGRPGSERLQALRQTRSNGLVTFGEGVALTDDLREALAADVVCVSVASQALRGVMEQVRALGPTGKTFVLCMKGIEVRSGMRLSEIAGAALDPSNDVAVWLGPGHVQEFVRGIPNCMVIDAEREEVKARLVAAFSGGLIRFYYGTDLTGSEVGAAAKNVIGIAAGMLDGFSLSSLKGALMARGTREIARLIRAMGGNELSAYGLCHLGDYEATVFSPYSHNRRFGEAFVRGEAYDELAEGYYTAAALANLSARHGVELPICRAVYAVLYEGAAPKETLDGLFLRSIKREF